MSSKRKFLYILICLMVFSLVSCVKTSDIVDIDDTITADIVIQTDTELTDPESVNDNQPEEIPDTPPELDPPFRNPLTGLPCKTDFSGARPMAIMINNIKKATPQAGISNADIIYECTVEGGITRLMALVCDYASLPDIGSVRSSREYYLDIAQSHDAIYAHCGGSETAYSEISKRKIDNIDGVNGSYAESSAYWKDKERLRTMGYEHASLTNGINLTKSVSDMQFRTELKEGFTHPLVFREEFTDISDDVAENITVKHSYYAISELEYDEESNSYKKSQYSAPHIDSNTNEQLRFENVLVLAANYYNTNDSYSHLILDFTGTGNGYYFSGGKIQKIIWSKKDTSTPYTLYCEDGVTPLLLNPGKSYIAIINSLGNVSIY